MVQSRTLCPMAFFSFFNRPKHQTFDYKPRFYDPDKEEREARMAKYRRDADDSSIAKSRISAGFRQRTKRGYTGTNTRRSNLRLIAILVVLLYMTYYFIQKYLPQIVDLLE